jgi:hypothetical protein
MKILISAISLLVTASLGSAQIAGGGSSSVPTLKPSPATVSLRAGAQPSTQTFKVTEAGVKTPSTMFTWTLSGGAGNLGTISSTGVYAPPSVPPVPNTVTVTATDVANKLAGTAIITVLDPLPVISSLSMSNINTGLAYVLDIKGTGFMTDYTVMLDGGYDTHSDQLPQQAQLFGNLAAAMLAFDSAMSQLGTGNNVTTFTESEFSRTFQPNGNAGTDHAWGGHHLVIGGAVKGGRIYGKFPSLELNKTDDSGDRGNWIPTVSTDQYGAALATWFGLQAQDSGYVFPNLANFGGPLTFL